MLLTAAYVQASEAPNVPIAIGDATLKISVSAFTDAAAREPVSTAGLTLQLAVESSEARAERLRSEPDQAHTADFAWTSLTVNSNAQIDWLRPLDCQQRCALYWRLPDTSWSCFPFPGAVLPGIPQVSDVETCGMEVTVETKALVLTLLQHPTHSALTQAESR